MTSDTSPDAVLRFIQEVLPYHPVQPVGGNRVPKVKGGLTVWIEQDGERRTLDVPTFDLDDHDARFGRQETMVYSEPSRYPLGPILERPEHRETWMTLLVHVRLGSPGEGAVYYEYITPAGTPAPTERP